MNASWTVPTWPGAAGSVRPMTFRSSTDTAPAIVTGASTARRLKTTQPRTATHCSIDQPKIRDERAAARRSRRARRAPGAGDRRPCSRACSRTAPAIRRAMPMQASVRNTNSTTPASRMPHRTATAKLADADFVVDAAERQQHDEHDHEQREEIEEALDRDRAEQGARRHPEQPAREHGARDLADVREHVVAGEAREHGGLQVAPAGLREWRDQVLPALGLHPVVGEEADHAEARSGRHARASDLRGEGGPVEPADGEVQEQRAERGAEEQEQCSAAGHGAGRAARSGKTGVSVGSPSRAAAARRACSPIVTISRLAARMSNSSATISSLRSRAMSMPGKKASAGQSSRPMKSSGCRRIDGLRARQRGRRRARSAGRRARRRARTSRGR